MSIRRVVETVRLLERTLGQHIRLEAEPGFDIWPTHVDPENSIAHYSTSPSMPAMPWQAAAASQSTRQMFRSTRTHLSSDARAGDYVRLRIRDTGTGCRRRFFSGRASRFSPPKNRAEGTGLGLSSVIAFARPVGRLVRPIAQQILPTSRARSSTMTTVLVYLSQGRASACVSLSCTFWLDRTSHCTKPYPDH